MAELFRSTADLIEALERPKRLITPCVWIPPGKHGQRGFRLKATLRDDVSAIRGLSLEIGCHVEGFDLPASVVLLSEFKNRPRAMARIDVNGSKHENRYPICGEWQHLDAGRTHFHDTRLHAALDIKELFSGVWDLPIARPISDMPKDFSEAMEKCGGLLHIENMSEIKEPTWQPKRLF